MAEGFAYEWDSVIEKDEDQFILLEEGDYDFTVKGFERGHYPGGTKLPACPKAMLTLTVQTSEGEATVKTDLLLCSAMEWRISAFFRSVGLKKHGEKLKMDWSKVPGTKGRGHFKPREFTGKDGQTKQANDCSRFLEPVGSVSDDNDDLPF